MAAMRGFLKGVRYGVELLVAGVILVIGLSLFSQKFGMATFTVLSGSMEPAIKTGSLIVTRPMQDYAVGDVVTRRTVKSDVTVTHRIVERLQKENAIVFHTKGDANELVDGDDIARTDIIGKVVYVLPYAGYPVNFSKSKLGFVLLVVIPLLLIIIEEIYNIRKAWMKRKEAKEMMSPRMKMLLLGLVLVGWQDTSVLNTFAYFSAQDTSSTMHIQMGQWSCDTHDCDQDGEDHEHDDDDEDENENDDDNDDRDDICKHDKRKKTEKKDADKSHRKSCKTKDESEHKTKD